MKNKEKYDNHNDALNAFYEMCYSRSCNGCQYYTDAGNSHHCVVAWLYDEAKGNKEKQNEDNSITNDNTSSNTNDNANTDNTSKKSLSERCRTYCDVIGNSGNLKEKLDKKILEIIKLYDSHAYFIEDFYTIDQHDLLAIEYLTSRKGWVEAICKDIPVKWLDFEIDEVKKIIKAQKEEQKKKEDTNG